MRMGWRGHVACIGEMRNAYRILIERSEWRKPLSRPERRITLKWALKK
jgi:hypothetical protein